MTEVNKLEINEILKLVDIESEISGADYVEPIDSFDAIGDIEGLLGNISNTDPNDDYHIAMGLITLSMACITYASRVNRKELKQLLKDQFRDQASKKLDFKNILGAVKEECDISFVLDVKSSGFGQFENVTKANLILLSVYTINKDDYHFAKVLIIMAAVCVTYAASLDYDAVKRLIKDRYIDNILNEESI
ncbi:hypothetical protein [Leptospira interrogans]|uniref:Uncharacterized protein n=1 Tax=Leptospira interrogans str. UI 12758 TaxID=1049938 RepID=A0A0E2DFF3_LEPIR|nr:hypothetical protein [Leptospira interrogans]EKR54390.1 hypothetical protein LEP1GSC105_2902 [Leptospira interrogans str. UI 12758]